MVRRSNEMRRNIYISNYSMHDYLIRVVNEISIKYNRKHMCMKNLTGIKIGI